MAGAVNPLRSPEAFDQCKIGGFTTPGLVEVTGLKIKNKWNVFGGMGIEHPIINYIGRDIDAFTIEIRMFDEDALDAYQSSIEPLFLQLPLGKRQANGMFDYRAFPFSHPITNAIGVRAVVVDEYNQIVQTDDGLWVARIALRPFWGAPKQKAAKPIAAQDERPKPEDAADRVILGLSDQISSLAKSIEKERGP